MHEQLPKTGVFIKGSIWNVSLSASYADQMHYMHVIYIPFVVLVK